MKSRSPSSLKTDLRMTAMQLPGAEEGIACAGTALEKHTIKVRKKAFLFVGRDDAIVKLGDSIAAARELAERDPGRFKVGANGWVTLALDDDMPAELLCQWVVESYRLLAPKALVAELDATAPSPKPPRRSRGR